MFKYCIRRFLVLAALCVAGFVTWAAWSYFGPQKPPINSLRQECADIVVKQIVRDLRAARGDVRSIVLLAFANDSTDYVTDHCRSMIETSGLFHLVDRPVGEKLRKALRLELSGAKSAAEALALARGRKADAVMFGSVQIFESFDNAARLRLDLHLVRLRTGELMLERPYDSQFSPGLNLRSEASAKSDPESLVGFERERLHAAVRRAAMLESRPDSTRHTVDRLGTATEPGVFRLVLAWLLAIFILPLLAFQFVRSTVRMRSNGTNARALALFVVLDMALAALVFGPHPASWVWLGLVGTALLYNSWVMSFALKLEL